MLNTRHAYGIFFAHVSAMQLLVTKNIRSFIRIHVTTTITTTHTKSQMLLYYWLLEFSQETKYSHLGKNSQWGFTLLKSLLKYN